MKLYIVRHGQTDLNLENRFQGRIDISINQTGISQAITISNQLKNEKIDFIYSSNLNRAIETATIINQNHNVPIYKDDRIIERSFGVLEGEECCKYISNDFWNHILDINHSSDSFYNIEPFINMLERGYAFLNDIINKYKDSDNNILLISHGAFMIPLLILLGEIYRYTVDDLSSYHIQNCACYIFENPTLINIKNLLL